MKINTTFLPNTSRCVCLFLVCLVTLGIVTSHAQTFETTVPVIQDPAMVNWFSDVEVNPVDATVDMVYVTQSGNSYHIQYVKLFADGTTWRTVDLGAFSNTSILPPYTSVTEYDGRVFIIGATEDGYANFFLSDDGGATFTSYSPSRFMLRADILANEFGCHAMTIDGSNRLAYAIFDPYVKSWTFDPPLSESAVRSVKPSLAEGDGGLFVVYQRSDAFHAERSGAITGLQWSAERTIPNSNISEPRPDLYYQLGPRTATTNQKVYGAWAGGPDPGKARRVGISRRDFPEPTWSQPILSESNYTYFGFAGNAGGTHVAYWDPSPWSISILLYRSTSLSFVLNPEPQTLKLLSLRRMERPFLPLRVYRAFFVK